MGLLSGDRLQANGNCWLLLIFCLNLEMSQIGGGVGVGSLRMKQFIMLPPQCLYVQLNSCSHRNHNMKTYIFKYASILLSLRKSYFFLFQ